MRAAVFALGVVSILSACGDPLDRVEKLSDVPLADTDPVRGALLETERPRARPAILAGLFGKKEDVAEAAPVVAETIAEPDAPQTEEVGGLALVSAEPASDASPAPRGFLARIFAGGPATSTDAPLDVPAEDLAMDGFETPAEAKVELAALEVEPPTQPQGLVEPEKRRRLFGGLVRQPRRVEQDAADVPFGTVLPFNTVGRVCEAKIRDLGQKVESAGRGRGYALFDSVPGSTTPRTFYLTGFADGCPRQFTAALAILGAPSMHEKLRYGRPSDAYPYSDTDKAYEKVKFAVCGVHKRKPCGRKIDILERDTVFVSTYERFTDNGRWADILVHDGRVMATALKTP